MYFADENLLGMGKLLRIEGRTDVLYPGHEDLPEIPRGAKDTDWLPVVGERGFIVLSRDRHIRSRPAELRLYYAHRVRSVWIGAKRDLGPQNQVELFLKYEHQLAAKFEELGEGPWALKLGIKGISRSHLSPQPR